eukprot:Nitzschia sp. Nitz4//NODE_464_length_17123_cov_69.824057//8956//13093//NITZ4_additional_000065-RA//-1//CDS//3329531921//5524//frame0
MVKPRKSRANSVGSQEASRHSKGYKRSISIDESSSFPSNARFDASSQAIRDARKTLQALLWLKNANGQGFLHHPDNLQLAHCLLERCLELDDWSTAETSTNTTRASPKLLQQFLNHPDDESAYTPLHSVIVSGNLPAILLYLRGAGNTRWTQRPMSILSTGPLSKATDAEGLTPLDLLGQLQVSELAQCRHFLQQMQPQLAKGAVSNNNVSTSRARQSSFSFGPEDGGDDELNFLSENLEVLASIDDTDSDDDDVVGAAAVNGKTFACEVVTFGRPHHCGLGVISSSNVGQAASMTDMQQGATFCPQRVQEFAQERLLRDGSAIAVAVATHHTLVVCRNGELYVFGLNKGGRLGLGDSCPQQCPLPRRILGNLTKRHVVSVSAADNHSLCLTKDGMVWAWGSNRFGQLGETPSNVSDRQNSTRSTPKRVEELRNKPCIAIAAGDRHSVAISKLGEVYVWGDNTSGQLGIARQTGVQKVQRVELLWGSSHQPKVAIAVAAAEQSTLVIVAPSAGLHSVNSVYSWGHGNHVPMRVQFENPSTSSTKEGSTSEFVSHAAMSKRLVNPVGIACAKYHNVVVTSEGRVYTWGTSSECLGRDDPSRSRSGKNSHRGTVAPQLVSGMLRENGGGFAVAVSASEQHTAVITDTGALFTWGVAQVKNAMGHEGVRWQPSPKRVPGVHRAVAVAVSKEHSVLLVGATFPKIISPSTAIPSLECLAARTVIQHVDLFNIFPMLIMAERTQCALLSDYCSEFVRYNLDGVLNLGKKSDMNQYLNDLLLDSLHRSGGRFRDDKHHPLVADIIMAGNNPKAVLQQDWFVSLQEWAEACGTYALQPTFQELVQHKLERRISPTCDTLSLQGVQNRQEPLRDSSLDVCVKKTASIDLSTLGKSQEASAMLTKEIRAVRKKLTQILKLEESQLANDTLTEEELLKVKRRSGLESELSVFQKALGRVDTRLAELRLEEQNVRQETTKQNREEKETLTKSKASAENDEEKTARSKFCCQVCQIRCPDETSLKLHQSGRKHRNKLAQEVEEEQTRAANMMERSQLGQLKDPPKPMASPRQPRAQNAWGAPSGQPIYKLPPPPHPVVAQVPVTSRGAVASKFTQVEKTKTVSPQPSSASLWATPKKGSTQRVPPGVCSTPGIAMTSPSKGSQPRTMSLADFLAPSPPKSAPSPIAGKSGWGKPMPSKQAALAAKSLADIQAEEIMFKQREERTPNTKNGGTGSWYIQRRERADSLHAIQQAEEQRRQEELLVQEQLEIERQIQQELAVTQKNSSAGKCKKSQGKGRKSTPPTASNRTDKQAAGEVSNKAGSRKSARLRGQGSSGNSRRKKAGVSDKPIKKTKQPTPSQGEN